MKKIMFLLALVIGFAMTSHAQRGSQFPLIAGDSINTVASLDTVFKTLPVTAGYSSMSIQVNTTKISGTISGKAYLYGSVDGVNFILSDSSAAFADQTTNIAQFTKTAPAFPYYQIQVRQMGNSPSTQVNRVVVWYALRKYNQ
jgi:hypothetical protein